MKGKTPDAAPKPPPKELSKRQELNNHIVCMRNTVAQARVQVINKLVHQIKKYKGRKGNEKDQEKGKRKASRLLEEIQALKKLKKDKASVYALQDTNELGNVLNDPTASSEEKVLSRVSHHHLIKAKVSKYREANPNWDKQIPVLLAMTREKRKPKKDSDSPNLVPLTGVVPKSRNFAQKTSEAEVTNGREAGSLDIKQKQVSPKAKEKLENISNKLSTFATETDEEGEEATSKPVEEDRKPTKVTVDKIKGTVKVQLLSDLNDLELDNAEENPSERAFVNITKAPAVKRPKSGFFVGGVDEPVDRTVPPRNQNREFQKPSFNSNRGDNSQSRDVYRKGKLVSKPSFKPKSDFNQKREPRYFNEVKPQSRFGGNFEPLHPRASKFGNNSESSQFQPRDHHKQQSLLNPQSSLSQPAPDKLHPSWEAKKKQQQITAFEGKRIVFNDDD